MPRKNPNSPHTSRLDHAFVAAKLGPWLQTNKDRHATLTTGAISALAGIEFSRTVKGHSIRALLEAMSLPYRTREQASAEREAGRSGGATLARLDRLETIVKRLCGELGIVCADVGGDDE